MSSNNLSSATLIFEESAKQENATLQIAANCTGCGRCVAACPAHALTLVTERANGFGRKMAAVDSQRCPNCGDCLPACPHNALHFPCL